MHKLALFSTLATASLFARDTPKSCQKDRNTAECKHDYLLSVCAPGINSPDADLNAPCNIGTYILEECVYGAKPNITKNGYDYLRNGTQSNSTQRLCICESQYYEVGQACQACFRKHGATEGDGTGFYLPADAVSSMSSAYCAATATPTLGTVDFGFDYLEKHFSSLIIYNSLVATTWSDPLASSTAISLYYTADVTGSAALDAGSFTATGTAKPTTTFIQEGQIVATASPNTKATGKTSLQTTATTQPDTSQGETTTNTSGIGSRPTEAAFAGVLGMVGALALL